MGSHAALLSVSNLHEVLERIIEQMPPKKSSVKLPPPKRHELAGSSVDQAANYLRRLIFGGILPAGSRVPQDDIASTLGMTRIPVREALHVLELEGRVRIEPNRGAFVVAVTAQSARDSNDLYMVLHRFASERALARQTPETLAGLKRANDDVQNATDLVDLHHTFDAFQDFIVRVGLDNRLASFIARLRHASPETLFEYDPTIEKHVRRCARLTVAAFKEGDLEKMEAVMNDYQEENFKRIVPLLQAEGIVSG